MKKVAKLFGGLMLLLVVVAVGALSWGKSKSSSRLAAKYETHVVDFPIPFPLTEQELADLKAQRGADAPAPAPDELEKIALANAQARGKHLVEARYVCVECHGKDFGGGTMVDAPPIGKILGVNITGGKGGVVANYKPTDWDRIVRHGVLPDGRPAAMPSVDFKAMTDRELSDVVVYVKSFPPVDADVARPTLGPVGTMLIATGKLPLSADEIGEHKAPHAVEPPVAADSLEFGKHLLGVCSGCHSANLAGGPVPGGDPSWPPARNLTPHTDGLAGWTYDDFVRALKDGKSKNGTELRLPMSLMKTYAVNLTETELKAMWRYLQSVPAVASAH